MQDRYEHRNPRTLEEDFGFNLREDKVQKSNGNLDTDTPNNEDEIELSLFKLKRIINSVI